MTDDADRLEHERLSRQPTVEFDELHGFRTIRPEPAARPSGGVRRGLTGTAVFVVGAAVVVVASAVLAALTAPSPRKEPHVSVFGALPPLTRHADVTSSLGYRESDGTCMLVTRLPNGTSIVVTIDVNVCRDATSWPAVAAPAER